MRTTTLVRGTAPVARSAFWLMMSLLAWELYQGLRAGAPVSAGSWPAAPVDLVLLILLPALAGFAFARLFLVITQSVRGSLSVYAVVSSPFAWVFWIGLMMALIGHGVHVAGHAINEALPNIYLEGELAAKIDFLDTQMGYLLLGFGFFLTTAVVLVLGQGSGQRIHGAERALFVLGSLATYGVVIIYLAVEGGHLVPVIAGCVALCILGLWSLSPYDMARDPIACLIMPGTFLAGLALIIWAVVVGGRPTWP